MGFEHLNVLVVEDEKNTLDTLRVMLKELGVQNIVENQDGLEASKALSEATESFDLVISDWNMPHKSGIELLKEVRSTQPNLPFIMVSARADMNSVENALVSKVTSYIRKPFSLNELEDKLKMAFRS